MSLYPLLYCSYIVISGSALFLHCYTRYCTAPTSLYPIQCCFYIVILGSVVLLHRSIWYCTASTSHFPLLRHCIISLLFYTYFVPCRPILLFRSRQISYSTLLTIVETSLITRGEWKKSTFGIRNFNLRKNQVRRRVRLV